MDYPLNCTYYDAHCSVSDRAMESNSNDAKLQRSLARKEYLDQRFSTDLRFKSCEQFTIHLSMSIVNCVIIADFKAIGCRGVHSFRAHFKNLFVIVTLPDTSTQLSIAQKFR